MKRIAKATIEETLVREVTFEVPEDVADDDVFEWMHNVVREKYKAGEIVLTADDFNGTTLVEIEDHNGFSTGWTDINN